MTCFICKENDFPDTIIKKFCKCKLQAHTHCLRENIYSNGIMCKYCHTNILCSSNEYYDVVTFPYHGEFFNPLLSHSNEEIRTYSLKKKQLITKRHDKKYIRCRIAVSPTNLSLMFKNAIVNSCTSFINWFLKNKIKNPYKFVTSVQNQIHYGHTLYYAYKFHRTFINIVYGVEINDGVHKIIEEIINKNKKSFFDTYYLNQKIDNKIKTICYGYDERIFLTSCIKYFDITKYDSKRKYLIFDLKSINNMFITNNKYIIHNSGNKTLNVLHIWNDMCIDRDAPFPMNRLNGNVIYYENDGNAMVIYDAKNIFDAYNEYIELNKKQKCFIGVPMRENYDKNAQYSVAKLF